MSYGETYGTMTLAQNLCELSEDIYHHMNDGKPWSEIREDVKCLMEGAMELWERLLDE